MESEKVSNNDEQVNKICVTFANIVKHILNIVKYYNNTKNYMFLNFYKI